jgi:uncharacterized membrane protein YfcA
MMNKNNPEANKEVKPRFRRWLYLSLYVLSAVLLMITGHLLLTFLPDSDFSKTVAGLIDQLDPSILLFIAAGFAAQMIDGMLGMAYGVSVTTFLMGLGIPAITPAVASASMHAAEVFTTGTSSLVYMRYRNVNMKLFRMLLLPGALGAVAGAITISYVNKDSLSLVRPVVACYTLILGILIVRKALNFHIKNRSGIRNFRLVALAGGFFDSIGGGGWGPIVTTTLVAAGRDFKYAVGSSHVAKFFVALISTITFFSVIGLYHWQIIAGLVIGSMIASPISIYFSTKISRKKGLILVGGLVVLISLRTLITSLF